jgi:hypothetical protein
VNGTFAFAWVVIYGVVVVPNMSMHQHDSSATVKERGRCPGSGAHEASVEQGRRSGNEGSRESEDVV